MHFTQKCSYAESKTLRKTRFNPAELAVSKTLASKQASEDVVGGANTTFGSAPRALGAHSPILPEVILTVAHLPAPHASHRERKNAPDAVVIAAARRQALPKNRGPHVAANP